MKPAVFQSIGPIALCLFASISFAEVITVGKQGNAYQSEPRPERGMRMHAVIEQYGQPITKHPAVGQPPIAKWEFDHYTVYFEYEYVIHSVLHPVITQAETP